MRKVVLLGMLVVVGVAACTANDGTGLRPPDAPRLSGTPDLVGTPDLIVDSDKLATSWIIHDELLPASFCSVQEANITPGEHRTLRFTVTTPNIGDADIFIGDPNTHMDPNGDGNFKDSDGLFEFATCHNHFHFRNYAKYELLPVAADGSLGAPIQAKKRGFCMIDVTPFHETSNGSWVYRSCGRIGIPGNQGISTGWADTYVKSLGGQYFLMDDPVAPVTPGNYLLRITVNPPFVASNKEPCPAVDTKGFCHMFKESDYSNNVGQVYITVPDRVGKTGWGPGGNDGNLTSEASDDEDRPTK